MSILDFWVEFTRLLLISIGKSFLVQILLHCDLSPGTDVYEFQSEGHASNNLKHLLSSNTCICSNINEKCHLISQTVVHLQTKFPTHRAVGLG